MRYTPPPACPRRSRLAALTPVAMALLGWLAAPAIAADRVWIGLGTDSFWHNTDNWAGGVLPAAGENAVIGAIHTPTFGSASGTRSIGALLADGNFNLFGGTLDVGATSRVLGTLTMTNGTLAGGWPINIFDLVWNGSSGAMGGTGITNVAGNAVLGDGINPGKQQVGTTNPLGRTVIFGNNTLFRSNSLAILLGSQVTNNGTFTSVGQVQGASTFDNTIERNASPGFTGDSVFANAGSFVQDASGHMTTVNARFDNTGLASVVSGTLRLAGGGTSPGSFAIAAGTTLSLSGTSVLTHVLSGSMQNNGALVLPGGGLVRLADGFAYGGTGSVSVSGGEVLQLAAAFAPASLSFANGMITGPQALQVGTLDWTVSGGTSTMTGGGTTTVAGSAMLGGTYQNLGGTDMDGVSRSRVLKLQGTTTLQSSTLTLVAGSNLINNGTLTSRGYRYVSSGQNKVTDSTVGVSGSGNTIANNGAFIQDAATLIRTTVNPLFTNSGTVEARAGLLLLQSTADYQPATQTLSGGIWKVSGGATLGINMGSGKSIVNNGASIVIDGASSVIGNSFSYYPSAGLAGFAHNLDGGSFELRSGAALTTSGAFDNAGSLVVGAGSTFSAGSGGSAVYAQGAGATVINGMLRASQLQLSGGTLSGSGAISGALSNAGQLSPGTSPGKMAVNGNFTQAGGGTLTIEIAGSDRGTSYDWLAVTGAAQLAGTLEVVFAGGFTPALHDSFAALSYGSHDGEFGTLMVSGLDPAYRVQTHYAIDGLTLEVVAVPEPSSYLLYASGLALVAWQLRRRRIRSRSPANA